MEFIVSGFYVAVVLYFYDVAFEKKVKLFLGFGVMPCLMFYIGCCNDFKYLAGCGVFVCITSIYIYVEMLDYRKTLFYYTNTNQQTQHYSL